MRQLLSVVLFCWIASGCWASSSWADLKPDGYIADFAEVLPAAEITALNSLLAQLQQQYDVELLAVTVPNLQGVSAEKFSRYLYDEWGVGGESNRAALVLMSRDEGQVHIYTGMGLRGALDSRWAKSVSANFDQRVAQKRYAGALVSVVVAMAERVHQRSSHLTQGSISGQGLGKFGTTTALKGGVGGTSLISGNGINGLPSTAVLAGAGGLLLLVYTFSKAQSKRSVYEWGRDFERGRTGAFGHKKPKWV